MKVILFFILVLFSAALFAQNTVATDTSIGIIKVIKDPRLNILAIKQAEYNKLKGKVSKGYRLMVINSSDRDFAMKVRAKLLQQFPEQKIYMSFQAPYIKIKFGNFLDEAEAEKYQKMITRSKIVTTSVYVVPDIIEIKPDKNKEKEDTQD